MSTSKAFKFADRQTRYAVFGYFRQCSESFSLHIPIPDLSSLLLSYIYDEDVTVEYFNIARSDYFEISTDKLTIRSLNGIGIQNHSIFLNQWIDSTSNSIAEWIFVIHSIANLTIFGLASSINDGYKNFRSDKPNYTIRSDGMLYYVLGRKRKCAGNCYEFNGGDTIKFTLDLSSDNDCGMLYYVLGRKRKCAGNCYEFNGGDTIKFTLDLSSDNDCGML
eukprot:513368_1